MEKDNKLYIYPTDTVWGIGASIYSQSANELIARIKQTEKGKPLSILFTSKNQMAEFFVTDILDSIFDFALFKKELSVGIPISFIKRSSIPPFIYGDSDLFFVRLLPELEMMTKVPVTTSSANISGDPPVKSKMECEGFIQHAQDILSKSGDELILWESELRPSGNASTMIFWKDGSWETLRQGKCYEHIAQKLGLLSA